MDFDISEIPSRVQEKLIAKGLAEIFELEGVKKIRINLEKILGKVLNLETIAKSDCVKEEKTC